MSSDILLEISLLIRAIIYAVLLTSLGVWALHQEPRFSKFLGGVALFGGLFNVLVACEWLYVFFIIDHSIIY